MLPLFVWYHRITTMHVCPPLLLHTSCMHDTVHARLNFQACTTLRVLCHHPSPLVISGAAAAEPGGSGATDASAVLRVSSAVSLGSRPVRTLNMCLVELTLHIAISVNNDLDSRLITHKINWDYGHRLGTTVVCTRTP